MYNFEVHGLHVYILPPPKLYYPLYLYSPWSWISSIFLSLNHIWNKLKRANKVNIENVLVQGFIIHILQVRKLKLRQFKWICPGPHTSLITELRCIQRWYDPCFVYQPILLFCDTPAKLVQYIVQNTNLV